MVGKWKKWMKWRFVGVSVGVAISFRLQRQPKSPFYYADFEVWNGITQTWERKFKSTKCTDPGKAAAVAERYWMAAQLAHGGGGVTGMTLPHATKVVNGILEASGLPLLHKVKSWKEWSEEWLAMHKDSITPASWSMYQGWVRRFGQFLGPADSTSLGNLTVKHCQDYWDWMRSPDGCGLAFKTAKSSLAMLRQVLEAARSEGLIPHNPARNVKARGDKVKVERQVFTPQDVQKLLQVAEGEWKIMIVEGLCTALRLMDCATLHWSEIRASGTGLSVHRVPRKGRRSGKVLVIPVVEPLLSALKSVPVAERTGFLCPDLSQRMPSFVSRGFSQLMVKAGIDAQAVQRKRSLATKSFHSLRHTLTSWMKSAGVDKETRMAITGHESAEIHDGYTHIEAGAMLTALNLALGRYLTPGKVQVGAKRSGKAAKA